MLASTVGEGVGEGDVEVAVGDGELAGEGVDVGVCAAVGEGDGVLVTVGEGLLVAVGDGVLVAVGDGVLVAVGDGLLVGVGDTVDVSLGWKARSTATLALDSWMVLLAWVWVIAAMTLYAENNSMVKDNAPANRLANLRLVCLAFAGCGDLCNSASRSLCIMYLPQLPLAPSGGPILGLSHLWAAWGWQTNRAAPAA